MEIVAQITGGIILILRPHPSISKSILPVQLLPPLPVAVKIPLIPDCFISNSGSALSISIILIAQLISAKIHAPLIIIITKLVKMELVHVHPVTMLVTIARAPTQPMLVPNVNQHSTELSSATPASVPMDTSMMVFNLPAKLVLMLTPTVSPVITQSTLHKTPLSTKTSSIKPLGPPTFYPTLLQSPVSLLTLSTHPIFVKHVHRIALHAPITPHAQLATHPLWPFCTLTVFVTCAT